MFSRDTCPPEKKKGQVPCKCDWQLQDEWLSYIKKNIYSHVALELKLKEVISDLGSALTRKHKHLIPTNCYRKVAARWRNLTTLIDLVDTEAQRQKSIQREYFKTFLNLSFNNVVFKCWNKLNWPPPSMRVHDPADWWSTCHLAYTEKHINQDHSYNKFIDMNVIKNIIKHTWHYHHSQQISTAYHCRLWPHVQISPLAS